MLLALLTAAGWGPRVLRHYLGADRFSAVGGDHVRLAVPRHRARTALDGAGVDHLTPGRRGDPLPGPRRHAPPRAAVEAAPRTRRVRPAALAARHGRVGPRHGWCGIAEGTCARDRRPRHVARSRISWSSTHPRSAPSTPNASGCGPTRRWWSGPAPTPIASARPSTTARAEPRVLFHGSFIPLHGVETIVRAATLLADTDLQFRVVGDGRPTYAAVEALIRELGGVPNLTLVDRMSLEGIGDEIRAASLCLGIFGTTPKAGRVVPFKVFEYMALRRPVVTGDTPAARHALGDDVVLVPPGGQRHARRRRDPRPDGRPRPAAPPRPGRRRPVRTAVLDRGPGGDAAVVARAGDRAPAGGRVTTAPTRTSAGSPRTWRPTRPARSGTKSRPPLTAADRRRRAVAWLLPFLVFLAAFVPRLQSSAAGRELDEPAWLRRSVHYVTAYTTFDLTNATSISLRQQHDARHHDRGRRGHARASCGRRAVASASPTTSTASTSRARACSWPRRSWRWSRRAAHRQRCGGCCGTGSAGGRRPWPR